MNNYSILATLALILTACPQDDVPEGGDDVADTGTTDTTTDTDTTAGTDTTTETTGDTTDTGTETGCDEAWAEIRCSEAGTCFASITGADTAVQVFHESSIEVVAGDPPCEPEFPFAFDIVCDIERCYAGADGWYSPYSCGKSVGVFDWPAWMCEGAAPSITGAPWTEAGCPNELATSCLGLSGEAGFEIWPDCLIDMLVVANCVGALGCPCDIGSCATAACDPGLECLNGACEAP